ncbi:MAG: hypothetical protein II708_03660 [Paludibacteraceae bacterium]|nr:hypothetical protein [Paludibacteraceae bacterium]
MLKYDDSKLLITDFYLNSCIKAKIKASVSDDLRLIDVGKLDSLSEAETLVKDLYAHL